MASAEILVSEVKKVSEGSNKRGVWQFWLVIDSEEVGYGLLTPRDDELLKKAQGSEGKKAKVNYEIRDNDPNKKSLLDFEVVPNGASDGAQSKLGTGDYIKGKLPTSERRGIAASISIQEAHNYAKLEAQLANVQREWTPALIEEMVDHWLERLFIWQLRKVDAVEESDIPFLVKDEAA